MPGEPRGSVGPDGVLPLVVEGNRLRRSYDATGDLDVLARSIAVLRHARDVARADSSERSAALSDLGLSLRARAAACSADSDLHAAVEAHEEAYRIVPPDSPHRAGMAGNLAGTLRQRYAREGRLEDLDRAIELYTEATVTVPPDTPYIADVLSNLANGLDARFSVTGARADLDRAVEVALAGVQATHPGSPELARRLANAAGVLQRRGGEFGVHEDLSLAVRMAMRAWELTPRTSAEYASRCSLIASVLDGWYIVTGEIDVLDMAVEMAHDGLEHARGEQVAALLVNLSAAHRRRYDVYRRPDDLVRSLDAAHHVLDRFYTAPTPDRAAMLVSTAVLHVLASDIDPRTDHLGAAGVALDEAGAIHPASTPGAGLVGILRSGLLHERWRRGVPGAGLDEAVRIAESAIQLLLPEGSHRARATYQLASLLGDRGAATGSLADLERSADLLLELQQTADRGDVDLLIPAAQARGLLAVGRGRDDEAAEAFSDAIAHVRRRFAGEVTRRHRQGALGFGQGMPAQAATAMAASGRIVDAAVALEVGQAMLASEALALDSVDLRRVEAVDPALAGRLRSAIARLHEAERSDLSTVDVAGPRGRLEESREEFERVLAAAREHPQLADLLAAPGPDDVLAAATDRPLVYLAADRSRGLAVVVPAAGGAGDVVAVPLPDLTSHALDRRLTDHFEAVTAGGPGAPRAVQRFLDWLGVVAVEPWLEHVGGNTVRIVPTGRLALCPLHAATVSAEPGREAGPLVERTVVSFVPNARAATATRSRAATRSGGRLLAVGNPGPDAGDPLPWARTEAEEIARLYPDATVLVEDRATLERVRELLASVDVAHLACHGTADLVQPERSALVLSGGHRLALGDLLRTRVRARLVVLSACETGLPGLSLPDEVVALPTGLVQAGAAGVVATFWRVADVAAAVLMVNLHERLRAGVQPATALAESQRWLRTAENRELAARWPELITGVRASGAAAREFWASGRPFADPRHWAAFAHFGA